MPDDLPDLGEMIDAQIRLNGPMSVAAYMALCMSYPKKGYYGDKDPLGATGDFVTAPEISQIFGELIGACLVDFWQRIGRPDPVILAELGPGPHRSSDIAEELGREVTKLGPTRSQLIVKGMIWSPSHGDTAFTVPLFNEFMKRIMPGDDWKR